MTSESVIGSATQTESSATSWVFGNKWIDVSSFKCYYSNARRRKSAVKPIKVK
jgi:hypothetical protein